MPPAFANRTVIGKRCCNSRSREDEMKSLSSTIAVVLAAAVLLNAALAQEKASGAASTPPAPNSILLTAPAKMPAIVVAAAQNVAHTIVQRKSAKGASGDPKEVFGAAADKSQFSRLHPRRIQKRPKLSIMLRSTLLREKPSGQISRLGLPQAHRDRPARWIRPACPTCWAFPSIMAP